MENTLENKANFFGQYWGQNVFIEDLKTRFPMTLIGVDSDTGFHVFDNGINLRMHFPLKTGMLLLNPLSQITDEDAIEVARIILTPALVDRYKDSWTVTRDFTITGYPYIKIHHPKNIYKLQIDCTLVNFDLYDMEDSCTSSHDMRPYHVITYLLSKGYYLGDGTEIKDGWVKLKEVSNA